MPALLDSNRNPSERTRATTRWRSRFAEAMRQVKTELDTDTSANNAPCEPLAPGERNGLAAPTRVSRLPSLTRPAPSTRRTTSLQQIGVQATSHGIKARTAGALLDHAALPITVVQTCPTSRGILKYRTAPLPCLSSGHRSSPHSCAWPKPCYPYTPAESVRSGISVDSDVVGGEVRKLERNTIRAPPSQSASHGDACPTSPGMSW